MLRIEDVGEEWWTPCESSRLIAPKQISKHYTVLTVWELQHRRIRDLGLAVNFQLSYPCPFGFKDF
jgi:hypothetical protein